jgi:hypothetical protein
MSEGKRPTEMVLLVEMSVLDDPGEDGIVYATLPPGAHLLVYLDSEVDRMVNDKVAALWTPPNPESLG